MQVSTIGRVTIPECVRAGCGFTSGIGVDVTVTESPTAIMMNRPADEAPTTSGDESSSMRARR